MSVGTIAHAMRATDDLLHTIYAGEFEKYTHYIDDMLKSDLLYCYFTQVSHVPLFSLLPELLCHTILADAEPPNTYASVFLQIVLQKAINIRGGNHRVYFTAYVQNICCRLPLTDADLQRLAFHFRLPFFNVDGFYCQDQYRFSVLRMMSAFLQMIFPASSNFDTRHRWNNWLNAKTLQLVSGTFSESSLPIGTVGSMMFGMTIIFFSLTLHAPNIAHPKKIYRHFP